MKDVTVRLATQDDDADIRRLLATNPMPGQLEVRYEREPDYFLGCGPMGYICQVVIGRQQANDELVGLACRSTRPLYINGQREEVGYLSQLRIDGHYRGRWMLPLGYRYMGDLHADGRVSGYITTIIEDNVQAIGLLVDKARGSIPIYRQVTHLHTLALFLRRRRALPASSLELSRGSLAELDNIVAFLNRHGMSKQFYPVYAIDDFVDSPITRGFAVDDLFLAWRGGELAGVIGLWDQSSYKQTVVEAYSGALGRLHSLYSLGLRVAGAKPLPSPGQPIRFAYASFICIKDDDADVFGLLLQAIVIEAYRRGYAYLMVGLAEPDPLLPVARRYWHLAYDSRLYTVCWKENQEWAQ